MTAILPFTQFILKVHSRCDLACDYCYMYEHADQSWRGRPLSMTQDTVHQVAVRIAEHVRAHQLPAVRVILHGGEPLLFGVERTRRALETLRAQIEPHCLLDLRIHTNAVRLDEAFCDLFHEHCVRIGVSLDGDRAAHDRHRRHADGRGSHGEVRRGLSLLRTERYRHLYSGLLCTVDVRNDPIAVYEGLAAEQPPRIDLLLPHATWERPPPRPRRRLASGIAGALETPAEYADWLAAVYDRWTADGRPFGIRVFDGISSLLRGGSSSTEALGLDPADLAVVETDGAVEQLDALKTAYAGAPATGLDVFGSGFDEAARHPGVTARQQGLVGLCSTCRRCEVVHICGGGLYPHRYSADRGFQNPSVYCDDLKAIIRYIRQRETVAAQRVEPSRPAHTLPEPLLVELAAGHGGTAAVRRLAEAQRSLQRRLLAAVLGPAGDDEATREAAAFLIELDRSAPAALDAVLSHPYTRVWAVRCIEALRPGHLRANGANGVAVAHGRLLLGRLNALALAGAVHGGLDARFTIAPVDGAVRLPGLGAALKGGTLPVPVGHADGVLIVGAGPGAVRIEFGRAARDLQSGPWQPIRRLTAPEHTVRLDDVDPHRDCHHWPPAARLAADEAGRWQDCFAAAAAFIDAHLPAYRDGLRSGLTTLVPLARPGGVGDASATARHAFGAVGAARPDEPDALALVLVHEFQHMKLGALLDEFDLFDTSDTEARYYTPWRPEPRPLEALLQGAYAHLAVTEFWRAARQARPGSDTVAEAQFARWRVHTAAAIGELLAAPSLTPLGVRFVAGMQATVQPWCDEPVGRAARIQAEAAAARHRAAYESGLGAARDKEPAAGGPVRTAASGFPRPAGRGL